jgi:hypothetical protein
VLPVDKSEPLEFIRGHITVRLYNGAPLSGEDETGAKQFNGRSRHLSVAELAFSPSLPLSGGT